MVHRGHIVLIDRFAELDKGVSDEEVCNVRGEFIVQPMLLQSLLDRVVDRDVRVVIFFLVARVV
jgi:hypothetical protein